MQEHAGLARQDARSWRPTSRRWARPSSSSPNSSRRAPTSCRSPTSTRSRDSRTRSSRSPSPRSSRSSPASWACASRRRSPSSSRRPWPPPRSGRCIARRCATAARSSSRCSAPASASRCRRTWTCSATSPPSSTRTPRPAARYEFAPILEEFRKTLLRELDYRQEARNLVTFADNLRDFDRIVVPQPVEDFTTSRVLTMDYISGRKITDL